MKNPKFTVIAVIISLMMTSCAALLGMEGAPTLSPDAIYTAAAETVVVRLTEGVEVIPSLPAATTTPMATVILPSGTETILPIQTGQPTETLIPSATAKKYVACDSALFVQDMTIPDGKNFDRGEKFIKTWRIQNIGSCLWNANYSLEFDSGTPMEGQTSIGFPAKLYYPGEYIDLSVELKAPPEDGRFKGYWGIKNQDGAWVPITGGTNNKTFYVEITVGSGVAKYTDSPGNFAVTKVAFDVVRTGACAAPNGKYSVTATITANKAGTVTYRWIRSDGDTGSGLEGSVVFYAAGKKSVTIEWQTPETNLWFDLYIDNPNHQKFKRATLTCS